jgi:hypothetical protein
MIENELQYRVTQEQATRLESGLAQMIASQATTTHISPAMQEQAKISARYLLAKLYGEIAVYEAEQSGNEHAAKRLPIWLRRTGWRTPGTSRRQSTAAHVGGRMRERNGAKAPTPDGMSRSAETIRSDEPPSGDSADATALLHLLEQTETALQTALPSEAIRQEVVAALTRVSDLPAHERRSVYEALGEWTAVVRALVEDGG